MLDPSSLIAGHTALDLVNTMGGAGKRRMIEHLDSFAAWLDWAAMAGLIDVGEARTCRASAGSPEAELQTVRTFRDALHAALMAHLNGRDWPATARDTIETEIRAAMSCARLSGAQGGYAWDITDTGAALPRHRAAVAAEDLLRGDGLARLRCCDRCSWLFLASGRGRPRRWCSMATCGSRDKSARYYRRHKAAAP